MRTVIFVLAGFAFLALCLALARTIKPGLASAAGLAVPIFLVLWALVAGGNMWVGIHDAGYSVMDELPIFLIIFLLPAAAALLVKWNWR